jgi:hypothetical protein
MLIPRLSMTRIYRAPAGDQSSQVGRVRRTPRALPLPSRPARPTDIIERSEIHSYSIRARRQARRPPPTASSPKPEQQTIDMRPVRLTDKAAQQLRNHGRLRAEVSVRRPPATGSSVYDMTQRLTTRLVRALIPASVIPVSVALLLGATSTTVGLLASAPQASARQTQVLVVSCNNVIASTRKPDSEERLMLGSFGAPPPRIQRAANGQGHGWQYFAKNGVEVEAGSLPVTVSVARTFRHRAAISWGNAQPIVQTVRFASCRATATRWDAYAGGFFLHSRTACVPLVVRVGSRSKTVRVGIGKSCP